MKTLLKTHLETQQSAFSLRAVRAQILLPPKFYRPQKARVLAARKLLLDTQANLRARAEKRLLKRAPDPLASDPLARVTALTIERKLKPLRFLHEQAIASLAFVLETTSSAHYRSMDPAAILRAIKAKHRGVVLYMGSSLIDGKPIAGVYQFGSGNRKTGAMRQTYIFLQKVSILDGIRQLLDASICGTCVHRPQLDGSRSCYVDERGLQTVWQSVTGTGIRTGIATEARYITLPELCALTGLAPAIALGALGLGDSIRLGSYGDPAAIPAPLWEALTSQAETWTGYTHQWENPAVAAIPGQLEALRGLVRASADDVASYRRATKAGWLPFVVTDSVETGRALRDESPLPVALCPASEEAGKTVQCAGCPIGCKGAQGEGKDLAVFIPAHGPVTAMRSFEKNAGKAWQVA